MEVRNEPPKRSRRIRIGCSGVLSRALSGNTGLPVHQVRRESENAADTANSATVNSEARTGDNSRGSADTVASAGRMDTAMKRSLACLLFGLIYTISPIDLSVFYAPDLVPLYGQTVGAVDDVVVDILMIYLALRRKGRK
jgi:uncharacterized membrane protein YkvA (DUF1232 family)